MFEKRAWSKGPFSIVVPVVLVTLVAGSLQAQSDAEPARVRHVKMRTPPRDSKSKAAAQPSDAPKRPQSLPAPTIDLNTPELAPSIADTELTVWPLSVMYVLLMISGVLLGAIVHFFVVLWVVKFFGWKFAAPGVPMHAAHAPALVTATYSRVDASERMKQWDMELGCNSYEDKEERAQRSEEAMLKELFNENVDLRRQIDDLAAA